MTRHIVVCIDGTWNRPGQKDRDRMVPTNVVEVARALSGCAYSKGKPSVEQLLYYDTGVGTEGSWFERCLGGATGRGLRTKLSRAYTAIAREYKPGDKLFLFGFSRGAYTVRSLAGLIDLCGFPTKNKCHLARAVDEATRIYAIPDFEQRKKCAKLHAKKWADKAYREKSKSVYFVGIWDTVGALGVPYWPLNWVGRAKYAFHNVGLGKHIRHAYHAVAIDERRRLFAPAMWRDACRVKAAGNTNQVVEQVWFPGVHSNVGGGYVDSGLSDRTLLWMCLKAAKAGLGFKVEYMNRRVDPNYHGELRDSCRHVFKLTARRREILLDSPSEGTAIGEMIHYSAKERFEHATEPQYFRNHEGRSLHRAIGCKLHIAKELKGERNSHTALTARLMNDGGGSPRRIGVR